MENKNNEKAIKAIQFLSKTDVDFFNIIDFEQMLFNAVLKGNKEAVKYLLDNDVNIHAQDDRAVFLACCNNQLEIAKYLVERGANIFADDCAALKWAANHGKADAVEYLLELGSDIHAENDFAFVNAFYGGHIETLKVLLKHGATLENLHDSPLQVALNQRDKELLYFIIVDCYIPIDADDIDYIEHLNIDTYEDDTDSIDVFNYTLNLINKRDLIISMRENIKPKGAKEKKSKI